MRADTIIEQGQEIYYMDFSFIREVSEINKVVQDSSAYIRRRPEGSLLTLTNVQGMHFNNEIREVFTNFVSGNKPYVKASAVIGLSGLIQILYNGLLKVTGRNLKAFSSREEAIAYLLSNK